MAVPYTFGTATASIPLSQLDSNFATVITLGNTAIQLGNTVTTLNNMTLANVTISSGNITLTNVSATTANVTTANVVTMIITGNETVQGNTTVTGTITGAKLIPTGSSVTGNGLYLPAANALGLSTNGTNAVYIDASQNVGIGTTSPSSYGKAGIVTSAGSGNGGPASAIANASLSLGGTATSGALAMGVDATSSYYAWIQATTTGNSPTYNLALNPSGGNVGIGTSSPAQKLQVTGKAIVGSYANTGAYGLYLRSDAQSIHYNWQISTQNTINGGFEIARSDAVGSSTFNSPSLVIDSNGSLLVGTSATINTNGVMLAKGGAAGGGIIQLFKTASGGTNGLLNYYQSTYVGGINYDNTSTSLATSSDIRLKKDIVDAPSAINVTSSIRVVSHGWKHDESTVRYGFVAQELINVAPEAVMQGDDGEEIEKTWTVDYARLVPMLVKTIQEQQALITSLTARIEALEAK